MSVEFFGVGGPKQIGNLQQSQKVDGNKKTEGVAKDSVQFSSVLQDVNKVREANENADAQRAQRVQELKAQIKQGSYQPDLKKVSASLLQFLVKDK